MHPLDSVLVRNNAIRRGCKKKSRRGIAQKGMPTMKNQEDLFLDMVEMLLCGLTYKQVGELIGVSRDAVRQKLRDGFRRLRRVRCPPSFVSVDFMMGVRVSSIEPDTGPWREFAEARRRFLMAVAEERS